MTRKAMTLAEVIIGMALFATLMVAVIESSTAIRSYTEFHERTDDLENEGRIILRQLSADLSNAAWFFERPDADQPPVPRLPSVIRPVDPASSFGDQLVFLKLRTERTISTDPTNLQVEHINLSTTQAKRMRDYTTASPVYSLVLNDAFVDNGSMVFVSSVWEADSANLSYAENLDRANLRHYRYAVEVHPSTGRGELRRYHINGLPPEEGGSGSWINDTKQRWGRHIAQLTIDTFVTTAGAGQRRLSPNQIRIHLELRRDGTGSIARATRTFQTTIALRSITNDLTN